MSTYPLADPMDVATDPAAHLLARADWEREVLDDVVLVDGPMPYAGGHVAVRMRFRPDEVDRRIAEVRAWFAARQRPGFIWDISAATEPEDLHDRLVALGAITFAETPVYTPMVLDHEPPAIPAGIEVRRVATFEDFVRMREVMFDGFEIPDARREVARGRNEAEWARVSSQGEESHVAYVEGEPAGCAGMSRTIPGYPYLASGTTLPAFRGRGVYRALIRARWDEAVRWGRPALATSAVEMSRPILTRLGFRAGPPVRVLEDRSGFDPPV